MMFDSRYTETQKIRPMHSSQHPMAPVDLRNTFYYSNDSWTIKDFGKIEINLYCIWELIAAVQNSDEETCIKVSTYACNWSNRPIRAGCLHS